jgi:rhodanese-related sulfurtransferase
VAEPSAIERHLAAARSTLDRVRPANLVAAVDAGDLIVDIRPETNRRAEGELRGAVVIERIHLEWRLDPTSPARIAEATPGRRVVVVCNEGYSSSLAAASLVALGVDATDLDGGYRALVAEGSPLVGPPGVDQRGRADSSPSTSNQHP